MKKPKGKDKLELQENEHLDTSLDESGEEDEFGADDSQFGAAERESVLERYDAHKKKEYEEAGLGEEEIAALMGTAEEEDGEDDKEDKEEKETEDKGEDDDDPGEDDSGDEEQGDEKAESEDDEKASDDKEEKESADESGDAGDLSGPRELTEEEFLAKPVKIKINGQESQVPVSELQKSYQIQGHLTQQLQQVAAYKSQVDQMKLAVEKERQKLEEEYAAYESQLFTPEELVVRKARRDNLKNDEAVRLQSQATAFQNILLSRHPDATDLDKDQDFIAFRMKNAPAVNEQLLQQYGPGAFYPVFDMTLQYYKDVKTLWNALQQAQDATKAITQERVKELNKRKEEQREQKKRAKETKPSTLSQKQDDDESTESHQDYVRKMKKRRLAAQGL